MLKKLENQPKSTVMAIREAFPENWFRYAIDKNGAVRVIYIADTQDELLTLSEQEMLESGYINWGDVYPEKQGPTEPLEIGGVDFVVWQD